MNIRILCVGKLKENYWRDAIAEYEKRMTRYCKVTLTEVPDESAPENLSAAEAAEVMSREGKRLMEKLKPDEYVIALDGRGQQFTSEAFSDMLSERLMSGKDLVFMIGGSLGFAPEVRNRADRLISLGKMTFPHQMVRLMLMEQLYRGFRILRGEPYHK